MSVSFVGTVICYTREIDPHEMTRSLQTNVTHRIESYSAIQKAFEDSLGIFDPFLEITPDSIDLLSNGVDQWDGRVTVYTNIDDLVVAKAVCEVFRLSEFRPPADQGIQNCCSLKFEEASSDDGGDYIRPGYSRHTITLEGYKLGSLEADTRIRLPIEPKSQEEALPARAPLPDPNYPDFNLLAAELRERQANIDRIQELTTQYLVAAGSMTGELGEYLNQANWHEILRSMGYVAGGAGFVALGVGGILGPLLEGVAFIARATGATVTAYDTARSEDAQQFAADIKEALELKLAQYCQPSIPRRPELTEGEPAEEVEGSEDLEPDWVLVTTGAEGLAANGDHPVASENIVE